MFDTTPFSVKKEKCSSSNSLDGICPKSSSSNKPYFLTKFKKFIKVLKYGSISSS